MSKAFRYGASPAPDVNRPLVISSPYRSSDRNTLLPVSALFAVPAAAASGFTVEDGVLVRYSGSAENVTVPDGVYTVGASAFEGNTKVKKVTLPATVYAIGDRAFYGCSALSAVTGGSVSSVGVFAFNGTPYFEKSTAEFFTLGSCLLWYNGTKGSVTLPSGVVSIAPYAFLRCDYLTAFSAPNGLVSVGEGAFYGCSKLARVSLPGTVTYIGVNAFTGTAFLSTASGFVTLGDGILVKYAGTAANPKLPASVRRIGAEAFADNTTITAIDIPAAVYSVDKAAFSGCSKLAGVTLNTGLVYIGDSAFAGTAIKELLTPSTLAYIGSRAFKGCAALDHVGLNGTKLTVASAAFEDCAKLRYALLGSGVSALNDYAFSGCAAMTGVSIAPDTLVIGSKALDGCSKVTVYCEKGCFAASALSSHKVSNKKGDVDNDGGMSIVDATRIQRWLAEMATMNVRAMCVGDMDYDGQVTVLDVTRIQRILAGLV